MGVHEAQLEAGFEGCAEFRRELAALQADLRHYMALLADVIGLEEDLAQPEVPDPA